MFATFSSSSTPPRAAARSSVHSAVKALATGALTVAAALAVMLALFALRLGLYAATHSSMPAMLHLFGQPR